ncbi:hypothetical protein A5734_18550 [Mycolicibacterium fortuitum]|nr:hypothetical protein A5734_18550 [Mycolicibacterium fortuitum]
MTIAPCRRGAIDEPTVFAISPLHHQIAKSNLPLLSDTDLQGQFNRALRDTLGTDRNPAGEYARKYEQITKIPDYEKGNGARGQRQINNSTADSAGGITVRV